jgi:16S rRNA (adenine1518-N6/adenine1519-N6)-dimethyltransferase
MMQHLKPLKRFGQNFLIDKNIIRKIIASVACGVKDCILEIGPGRGALTFELAGTVQKLLAIEVDRGLAEFLKNESKAFKNIHIICQDALKLDLKYMAKKNKIASFKVVSNLPYYITTPLIEYLFKHLGLISDIFVMVQKEVAERMVAKTGDATYSSFSCFVNHYCRPEILFKVKRGSFYPVPKVDSCFVRLRPRPKKERLLNVKSEGFLFKVIRSAFGQRRKRLYASLSKVVDRSVLNRLPAQELLLCRAEELSLGDFIRLSNLIFDNCQKR